MTNHNRRGTFDIRASSFRAEGAFTILELLVVITIIIVLAGLILSTVGYVQKKGARSRAEAEMAAMSASLESYKAANGVYPQPSPTPGGSHALYQALAGDGDDAIGGTKQSTGVPGSSGKSYMPLKSKMVSPDPNATPPPAVGTPFVIRDPFGNPYGYVAPGTHNPTFDLWSQGESNS